MINAQSILGSVAIGKDTSGNFRQSIHGIAVRTVPNGPFVARHGDELIRVTDLTFEGTESLIFRVPTRELVPQKDLIIRSDDPFSALFVERVHENGTVKGIDPATGFVEEYRPVQNAFGISFFVTVVGPEALMGGDDDDSLWPLLLLANQSGGGDSSAQLTTILLMQGLGSGHMDRKALMALLLSKGSAGGSGMDAAALMLALRAGGLGDSRGKTEGTGHRRRGETHRESEDQG